jgi:hypothetical protein
MIKIPDSITVNELRIIMGGLRNKYDRERAMWFNIGIIGCF